MRVTLVFPARERDPMAGLLRTPPAGITLLAALTPEGVDVELVDMLAGDRVDFDDPPDLVGLTVRTPVASVAYQIADRFRAAGSTVVLGGPHASAVPLDAAAHADAVVVGEAETTWPRLLDDFREGRLQKFYVCGSVGFQPGAETLHHEPELPSLAGLPVARRDLLPRRYPMDTVFSTRGCPYDCSFCPVTRLFGAKPRHRPLDEVVAEVETLAATYFNVDDNIFGIPGDEQYYLDLYGELGKLGTKRRWTGQAGLGVVDSPRGREILRRAADSGLVSVSVGIESVTQQGLDQSGAWRKLGSARGDAELARTANQIRLLQDHGLDVAGWFVIGWDGDDPDTYARSIDFADRTGIAPIVVNLLPLPGTRCHEEFVRDGRMRSGVTWSDYGIGTEDSVVYTHPIMGAEEMVAGRRRAMARGYSWPRVLRRARDASRRRPGWRSFATAVLVQRNLARAFGS